MSNIGVTTVPAAEELLAHGALLRALVRSVLQDEHGADDVVQETCPGCGSDWITDSAGVGSVRVAPSSCSWEERS